MVGDLRGRRMRTGSKIENPSTSLPGENHESYNFFILFNVLCNMSTVRRTSGRQKPTSSQPRGPFRLQLTTHRSTPDRTRALVPLSKRSVSPRVPAWQNFACRYHAPFQSCERGCRSGVAPLLVLPLPGPLGTCVEARRSNGAARKGRRRAARRARHSCTHAVQRRRRGNPRRGGR